jgi:hypothetical protein
MGVREVILNQVKEIEMNAGKKLKWLSAATLVMFAASSYAGAPANTVNTASVSLKAQVLDGGKIKKKTLSTNNLINLLTGNSTDINAKPDKNLKLVAVLDCDGDLFPMYLTVWNTDTNDFEPADYMEFDGDFTLIELNKKDELSKSSAYIWNSEEGGALGSFQEINSASSASFKKLPKKLDNPSICVGSLKSSAVNGEIGEDVVNGENWVITGGNIKASKPLAIDVTFPPIL